MGKNKIHAIRYKKKTTSFVGPMWSKVYPTFLFFHVQFLDYNFRFAAHIHCNFGIFCLVSKWKFIETGA